MKVSALNPTDAKKFIEAKAQGLDFDLSRVVYEMGVGDLLSTDGLESAVARLTALQGSHPPGAGFDAEACVALHESLPIDDATSGNPHFWVWLAVVPFFQVVTWRHRNTEGRTNPINFGIGARWSNLLARLWYRAELVYDPVTADPYELARRGGDVEFWESGIIRHRYSSSRPLARALVRFQYPDENPEAPSLRLTGDKSIRELYKRLKRMQATLAYETMDEITALELIRDLATGLDPA